MKLNQAERLNIREKSKAEIPWQLTFEKYRFGLPDYFIPKVVFTSPNESLVCIRTGRGSKQSQARLRELSIHPAKSKSKCNFVHS